MPRLEFSPERLADVSVLAGSLSIENSPLLPWSEAAISFLGELSRALLKAARIRDYPDVASFAYWCRAARLTEMKRAFLETPDAPSRLGRGLALSIAPANIPINFAFSFAFSLLAGNASVVRVPSRDFAQVEVVTSAINEVLGTGAHPEVERRSAFVRYPSTSEATEAFSEVADARLLWGGDATVARIGALARSPRCKDVVFADRYSIAVLDGAAVLRADEEEIRRLAQGFYNDSYLMDQNACSSPHLLFWYGGGEEAQAAAAPSAAAPSEAAAPAAADVADA
ncbi:MAG: hypothetical protein LBH64_03005, partial [Coriobacteriales bacterium]|nr:hypothetical protein [Coriobacteriales bacterium]